MRAPTLFYTPDFIVQKYVAYGLARNRWSTVVHRECIVVFPLECEAALKLCVLAFAGEETGDFFSFVVDFA